MQATPTAIDILNGLLRGELAAIQAYDQALEKVEQEDVRAALRPIRVEHSQAVLALQEQVRTLGGEPDSSGGEWGAFTGAVEGGDMPALGALKQGEEQGIAEYEKAADQNELPPECRVLIRTSLLPQTRAHVATLERLTGS